MAGGQARVKVNTTGEVIVQEVFASSTIPWARSSKGADASNQTIANNSVTTVTFNHDYNMGTGESGNAYFLSTGDNIRILVHGVYIITAEIIWFESITFDAAIAISDGVSSAGHYFAGATTAATTISQALTFVHNYTVNTNLALQVLQNSGSNKNVDVAFLHAWYLGNYTGTEWTSMNP